MGAFAEYLSKNLTQAQLIEERNRQLSRISAVRKRGIVVYASDLLKDAPTGIGYGDLPPFYEQLENVKTKNIDILLETPGGDAVIVEDMVKRIRAKFGKFGVIIPGFAKSAGTIFAMAADEILMSNDSALGPIDAQISRGGKSFSASAFLDGIEALRKKYQGKSFIEPVDAMMLSSVTVGEIEGFKNAQAFAQDLVSAWLSKYKFKSWAKHRDGRVVSEEEKIDRAVEIAKMLGDQSRWLTHGRSIHIDDLRALKLQIVDFDAVGCLGDAVRRYHALLRLTFDSSVYKIYETQSSHIMQRLQSTSSAYPRVDMDDASIIEVVCPTCRVKYAMQMNFAPGIRLASGVLPFPANDEFVCLRCKTKVNLSSMRQHVEIDRHRKTVK